MMTKLIAATALLVAFFAGMAFALAAAPHPDRPMTLLTENPMALPVVPVDLICAGTLRAIHVDTVGPMVVETELWCEL